MLEPVKAGC